MLPETNTETIADDEAQSSAGKINSELIGYNDEAQRSLSTVDENDIVSQRIVSSANIESQRSDPRQMMAI